MSPSTVASARRGGFTLIELMIVIAILAVLLGTAIPAYQDFTIRAKVAEALNAVTPVKAAIAETWTVDGAVPDQASTGYVSANSQYVADVSIANDGSGIITATTQATGAAVAPVFRLIPTFAPTIITWECELVTGETKHVPGECRS